MQEQWGYGWLNAGWGCGAFLTVLYAPQVIAKIGTRRAIAISTGILAIASMLAPLSPLLAIAVFVYAIMGSGRGMTGIAMNTGIMEQVRPISWDACKTHSISPASHCRLFWICSRCSRAIQLGRRICHYRYCVCASVCKSSWPIKTATPNSAV